jgi:hypothetical protein
MKPSNGERSLCWLIVLTGVGEVVFWALFYTVGLAPDNAAACYMHYERAFLVPDLVVAVALIVGGLLRAQGRPWGRLLTHACAGALAFLGMLDMSFNLQNGIYRSSTLDLVMNASLNAYCVLFGVGVIWFGSRSTHPGEVRTLA